MESDEWIEKIRVIMDGKATGVAKVSRKGYRAILPRLIDAMHDVLRLQYETKTFGDGTEGVMMIYGH